MPEFLKRNAFARVSLGLPAHVCRLFTTGQYSANCLAEKVNHPTFSTVINTLISEMSHERNEEKISFSRLVLNRRDRWKINYEVYFSRIKKKMRAIVIQICTSWEFLLQLKLSQQYKSFPFSSVVQNRH